MIIATAQKIILEMNGRNGACFSIRINTNCLFNKKKNNPINDDRRITRFVSKNLCVETKDGIILKTIDTDSGPKGLSIDNLKGTNIAEFELMLRFKIVDNKINVAFKLES